MAVAVGRVDHCRVLGDFVTTVEQARNKQFATVGIPQHDAWSQVRRNDAAVIAPLLVGQRQRLPDFGPGHFGSFGRRSPLWRVWIVGRAAAGGTLSAATAPPAATTKDCVTDVKDWPIRAIHRDRVTVTV